MPNRDHNDNYHDNDIYSYISVNMRESQRLGLSDTGE